MANRRSLSVSRKTASTKYSAIGATVVPLSQQMKKNRSPSTAQKVNINPYSMRIIINIYLIQYRIHNQWIHFLMILWQIGVIHLSQIQGIQRIQQTQALPQRKRHEIPSVKA